MNKKSILSIAMVFLLVIMMGIVVVKPVQAASINNTGIIKAGEVIDDDLLLGANTVQMDGTVNGIVIAGGTTITITGTVNGDVIACGKTIILSDTAVVTGNVFAGAQSITINGTIGGSLFAGSTEVTLGATSSVGRNTYYGGYSLTSQSGSVIGKDLRAGAYQAILHGEIKQDAAISAGAVELYGKIGHNAEFWLGDSKQTNTNAYMPGNFPVAIKPGLRVDPSAQIAGKLIYTSSQKYDISAVPAGGIVYNTPSPVEKPKATFGPGLVAQETGNGFKVWHALSSLITLLLAGALAVGLFGKCFGKTVDVAQKRTLASAGVGLLVIVAAIPAFMLAAGVIVLVGIILSFISLGGLTYPIIGLGLSALGLAGAVLIVLISVVSKLIVAYLVGELIFKSFKVNLTGGWQKALPLIVGVLIYVILSSLPFFGWLFNLIATIIGLGAIWFLLVPGKSAVSMQPELPINA